MTSTTDSANRLITPGFVDAHIHPDKTSWGSAWLSRKPAASLSDLISNDMATQLAYRDSVEHRMGALVEQAIANGTTAMRAHIDFGTRIGLKNIHAARSVAEKYRELLDLQVVAFPQFGLLTDPGSVELLEAALTEGADLVGGIDPVGLEHDLHGHLDVVFGLSQKHGRDIDIHVHDMGPEGLAELREIASRTKALGLRDRVTVGHAFAICEAASADLEHTLEALAEAGVWIATCALGPDPVPDLDLLEKHGVKLALGSDGVRDAWSPFGTGSMVDRMHLLGYRTGAITDAELRRCFEIATSGGARLLGIDRVLDFDPATATDYVQFDQPGIAQLVVDRPVPAAVVRGGHRVAAAGALLG